MHRVMLSLLATAAAKDICTPMAKHPPLSSVEGRKVELESKTMTLSRWDAEIRRYVPEGLVSAQILNDKEFSAMTHGAKIRRADVRRADRSRSPAEFSKALPPVYFTGTVVDKYYMLDSIDASAAPLGSGKVGPAWNAELKMLGWTVAPSVLYPIEGSGAGQDEDELQGFLIAGGNPFVEDPGNHSHEFNLGGITYMSPEGCTKLFPVLPDPYAMTGRVTNTIDCHKRTGVCFFSAWKFDGGPKSTGFFPDCLWFCKPDNLTNPQKCTSVGVMKDENGQEICRDYRLGGGVHGLTVMHDDPADPNSFELLLVFTAGTKYDTGGSWMSMLNVSVSDTGDEVMTRSQRLWGSSLWNDTVTKPHDVGCDHATLDDAGRVWVSTFRSGNAGVHMLDYDGTLQYSIHGFDFLPGQYSYPAGLSGFGTLFEANSMMAVATSAEKMGVPIFGTATMFLIDISKLITDNTNATDHV
uniref:SMP-30/Gluconolactonase/LRE-like region domain-containing protein n=1 Tax=Haptolina brevifila TaxID=156173 RepID=A0A7S2JLJ6_9EUKA|mmetsp:Transcript_84419/g.168572  ORF Transcript_84419/g.168572 Transcript_84419/m.168572 type:complete len:468 (+) Transcript_84419:144-1547(+)